MVLYEEEHEGSRNESLYPLEEILPVARALLGNALSQGALLNNNVVLHVSG